MRFGDRALAISNGAAPVWLASTLVEFHGEQAKSIRLVTELGSVVVLASAAVPLGIIATEFITNSFKYAFDGAPGTIGVRLESVTDKVRMTLWDDGKGLPDDKQAGTGMQLVAGFARGVRPLR